MFRLLHKVGMAHYRIELSLLCSSGGDAASGQPSRRHIRVRARLRILVLNQFLLHLLFLLSWPMMRMQRRMRMNGDVEDDTMGRIHIVEAYRSIGDAILLVLLSKYFL